jgi:hypothetical protein
MTDCFEFLVAFSVSHKCQQARLVRLEAMDSRLRPAQNIKILSD